MHLTKDPKFHGKFCYIMDYEHQVILGLNFYTEEMRNVYTGNNIYVLKKKDTAPVKELTSQ